MYMKPINIKCVKIKWTASTTLSICNYHENDFSIIFTIIWENKIYLLMWGQTACPWASIENNEKTVVEESSNDEHHRNLSMFNSSSFFFFFHFYHELMINQGTHDFGSKLWKTT